MEPHKNARLMFRDVQSEISLHSSATKLSEEILSQKGRSGIISYSPRLLPKVTFETFPHLLVSAAQTIPRGR